MYYLICKLFVDKYFYGHWTETCQKVRYFQGEKCGFKTAKPQGKKNAVLIFKTAGKTKCGFKTARKKKMRF